MGNAQYDCSLFPSYFSIAVANKDAMLWQCTSDAVANGALWNLQMVNRKIVPHRIQPVLSLRFCNNEWKQLQVIHDLITMSSR